MSFMLMQRRKQSGHQLAIILIFWKKLDERQY